MSTERFEEIVSRYADGAATPEELVELERLMQGDAALRKSFAERMRLEVALSTLSETSAEERPASRRAVRSGRSLQTSTRSSAVAWAAAAAVLVAAVVAAVLTPRTDPVDRTARLPQPEDPVIAVRTEDRRKAEEEKSRAEADRKLVEERLLALRRKEGEAALEREREEQLEARRRAEEALRAIQADREAAEARLREADERERRALEEVTRVVVKETPVRQPSVTAVAAARIDRVEGEVYVTARAGRKAAAAGQDLLPGEGVSVPGTRGFAVLSFPDKSRLELSCGAAIRDVYDADAAAKRGKRVFVERGSIKADVAPQPKDLPLVVGSPQAELKVVGTSFRLTVDASSVLEVEEGKVELRTATGKSVDVAAGRMAIATPGTMPVVRALPKEELLLALDFEDGKKSALVTMGAVERGPDRGGNRFVLAGIPDPSGVSRLFIGEDALGLFTFQGDEVLSFDYWADTQSAQVNFNFYSRSRQEAFQGFVPKPVFGKWAHASIRLSELGTPESRLREEDWVVTLYMQATGAATKRFYVDNVQITRSRVLKPRPSDAKK